GLQGRRGGRGPGLAPLFRGVVRGLGLLHERQGGEYLADLVGVLGVAAGELLHRGPLPLPQRLHELVRDLAQRVRGGRIGVIHPQMLSMPPGKPCNASLSRTRARTQQRTAAGGLMPDYSRSDWARLRPDRRWGRGSPRAVSAASATFEIPRRSAQGRAAVAERPPRCVTVTRSQANGTSRDARLWRDYLLKFSSRKRIFRPRVR